VFRKHWPAYRAWFLSEGDAARPSYLGSYRALKGAMPELAATYERLVELAGGGDLAARFLCLYRPPPYLSGCSQAVWSADEPLLIRNYDYAPRLCEGSLLCTAWNGRRAIVMGDCLWGVLDGMNEDGLAVSLAFGGCRAVGDGFGAPLLLRYLLEVCATSDEAAAALRRLPSHMAYNVTVLDRAGSYFTARLAPDRPATIVPSPIATNHQGRVAWRRHAALTRSVERERFLQRWLAHRGGTADALMAAFLRPPLYAAAHAQGHGTLYTAIYYPRRGEMEVRWPDGGWRQSFRAFREDTLPVRFPGQAEP
jgi:predicted choloylglycine hydrolase